MALPGLSFGKKLLFLAIIVLALFALTILFLAPRPTQIPPSNLSSLPLSSLDKSGTKTIPYKDKVVWTNGLFRYMATPDNKALVRPFALTGRVSAISGRDFEITSLQKPPFSFLPVEKARIRLLETGEAGVIVWNKNQLVSTRTIPYWEVKIGNLVEFRNSLTPIGKNYYSSPQVIVMEYLNK